MDAKQRQLRELLSLVADIANGAYRVEQACRLRADKLLSQMTEESEAEEREYRERQEMPDAGAPF